MSIWQRIGRWALAEGGEGLSDARLTKYARWSKVGTEFTQSIIGCARCHGEGHQDLVWKPFTHPIEYEDAEGFVATHWCLCPTNGEPIMMGGFDDEELASGL